MTQPTPITKRQQLVIDHDKLQKMVTDLATLNRTFQTRYKLPDTGPAEMLRWMKNRLKELSDAEAALNDWNQPTT